MVTIQLLRQLGLAAAVVVASFGSQPANAQAKSLTPPEKRTEQWIEDWADFIRPSSEELSYESIGWRNEFWPAVQLAQELGRPILLWTMNGHPLGCT